MYRNKGTDLSNWAEGEGTKMNQVNARREIIGEWRSLPKELRQTDEQAAAFAMQIKDKWAPRIIGCRFVLCESRS